MAKKLVRPRKDLFLNLRISSEDKARLVELARADHRSLSGYIVHVILSHADKECPRVGTDN